MNEFALNDKVPGVFSRICQELDWRNRAYDSTKSGGPDNRAKPINR